MRQIIETDQRHIFGHTQARAIQSQTGTISHLVVGGDHSTEINARIEQLVHGSEATRFLEITEDNQCIVKMHVPTRQFSTVARQPLLSICVIQWA